MNAIVKRVRHHYAAGADHVAIQAVTRDHARALEALRILAWWRKTPDPDDLDAGLLAQCLALSGQHGAGAVRAMALEILEEWRLCRTVRAFGDWLVRGAPSDDRIAERT